jgi:tetratricopeptide (TPR) repeat protein
MDKDVKDKDVKEKDVEYWFDRGNELYDSGNFEEAIKCYAQANCLNPNDHVILNSWGLALSDLAEIKQDSALFQEAIEKYGKAVQLKPEYADAFNNWGLALHDLAQIKRNESLFQEAFKKYEKATDLKSDEADTFNNWGSALSDLALIKHDETLFQKAFEKYEKATQLKPSYFNVFNNWGNVLSDLALIKRDETLFQKAFEKYEKATQLNVDYHLAFNNWGATLLDLAKIKHDEFLFQEAIEKCKKAISLNTNFPNPFRHWGNALYELAKIKHDEFLFQKAFEKYEEAIRLKADYHAAFNDWGNALYELNKIKHDESSFQKAIEKYENFFKKYEKSTRLDPISAFYNLVKIFYKLYSIKKDKILAEKAKECFEKAKKGILGIFVSLNEADCEEITSSGIFYQLLDDSKTNDGKFFKETTENLRNASSEELNKYKDIYILSIFIISRLHVNNNYEKHISYYREKRISQEMLFGDSKLWLSAINYSNDPTEGRILLDYLYVISYSIRERLNKKYGAFASCFTFNYDSLNQFRLYGKDNEKQEGTGLSLVFRNDFFSKEVKMAIREDDKEVKMTTNEDDDKKHTLFRCIYIDPLTQRVETVGHKEQSLFYREAKEDADKDTTKKYNENTVKDTVKKYKDDISNVIDVVNKKMEDLKKLVKDNNLDPNIVGQLLINLRYLIKHVAFKEEQECRILRICRLDDENVKKHNFDGDKENILNDKSKMYIEYDPKVSTYIEKIYFGPKTKGIEIFQDFLFHNGLDITCEKSKNPLA